MKLIGRALVVVTVTGVAGLVAQRVGLLPGGAPAGSSPRTLPLSCRLRRHGWRVPRSTANTPLRITCSRCEQIDVPMP